MAIRRIGQIFVDLGMITEDQLETLLEEQKRRPGDLLGKVAESLGYLTEVLQQIVSGRTKNHELHTLLPWNWRPPSTSAAA